MTVLASVAQRVPPPRRLANRSVLSGGRAGAMACALACVLACALTGSARADDVSGTARCDLTLAALALPGERPLTYAEVDAATLPAVLEAAVPYCGAKLLWFMAGQHIASRELEEALRWLMLARVRTLLERMADPRTFNDEERWRYRRLDRAYKRVLEPYRLAYPEVEREQIRKALSWDRLYPSRSYPPSLWPGLYASSRARLTARLEELDRELSANGVSR